MRQGAKGAREANAETSARGATNDPGARGANRVTEAADASSALTAADIQQVMWRDVGLFRDRTGLERAVAVLEAGWTGLDAQMRNGDPLSAEQWRRASVLTVGRLIARAALRREESRGGHYRSDFPGRDDINWTRRITETR
jgi:succinate dehydrogenase/fumarate reductase flavoprotein subunit